MFKSKIRMTNIYKTFLIIKPSLEDLSLRLHLPKNISSSVRLEIQAMHLQEMIPKVVAKLKIQTWIKNISLKLLFLYKRMTNLITIGTVNKISSAQNKLRMGSVLRMTIKQNRIKFSLKTTLRAKFKKILKTVLDITIRTRIKTRK